MMRVFERMRMGIRAGMLALALWAAPAMAEPVAVPEAFEPFGALADAAEAFYSYRRGAGESAEIIVFRMRDRGMDARLAGQIRDILALDCSTDARFADLGSSYQSLCDSEYVAYARVFESHQGVCIVAVAIRWPALEMQAQSLRQWLDALQACAPEPAWTDT